MNLFNYTRQVFFVLLLVCSFGVMQAQKSVEIVNVSEVHTVDIEKATAPDLDWGETPVGSAVRARVEFTNTTDEDLKLIKVISEPGCYPVGNRLALKDVTVEPGKKQDFFVFARAEELGTYSYKVELIFEGEKGKKERMAVFNYHGKVVSAE